ncbi:MAG: ATP-dependent DNA helicase RecQ [Kangiellaceae bacterium]|jgi:ATP-dependent DNA helicase RecQ
MQDNNKTLLALANKALKDVFGFDHFRASQQHIIDNVLSGKNTLAIMPTGGGKSLCYQIPGIVFDGLTLVISPLISLMQDQVRQLDELNVQACVLNSALSTQEYQQNIQSIKQGQTKLLFLAPETVLQPATIAVLKELEIACVAIDEAHCISEWGHEFRPEYRQLHQLVGYFPKAVVIALTATATPRVREDIKRQLLIDDDAEFMASFDRPNLYIEVVHKDQPYQQAKAFIDKHPEQSGIIYCQSRSGVDELSNKLQADGYKALPYHAGLNSQKRSDYQHQFVYDDVNIIVATIAFGMGINKPDVRYVLHYDLPKNIEGYYQQIGRAGRDGLNADCLLLFGYGDTGKIRYFIDQMQDEQQRRLATMHLGQMLALAETQECRRIVLLQYFGETDIQQDCQQCDNCLNEGKEKSDLTVPAQKFLSCVHRTGQRFGASHIVDVLRGSSAEKILQNQHNLLSTYNIGGEFSKKQWMTLARQLIQKGILSQEESYGGLRLTPLAGDVLKGNVPFFALLQQPVVVPSSKTKTNQVAGEQGLVDLLKKKRKQLADEGKVPPYAIFADRSLHEMAHYFPQSQPSLLKIHGVGQAKLDKYGEMFLVIIGDYCRQHGKTEIANNTSPSGASKTTKNANAVGPKTLEIAKQFGLGFSVLALSQQHKVQANTVYAHLYKYVQAGNVFDSEDPFIAELALPKETIKAGAAAFKKCGYERLKPVYDALDEAVTYEQLHLLRVLFLSESLSQNV